MSLKIYYIDNKQANYYANLLFCFDKTKCYNYKTNSFQKFDISKQNNFAIPLERDVVRKTFYSYEIEDISNIEESFSDFYIIEYRRKNGEVYDINKDLFVSSSILFWNGNQEVEAGYNLVPQSENVISNPIVSIPNIKVTDFGKSSTIKFG